MEEKLWENTQIDIKDLFIISIITSYFFVVYGLHFLLSSILTQSFTVAPFYSKSPILS